MDVLEKTVKAPADLGIVVDDGSVRVPIRNTLGDEIGVFRFRPTDFGMIDRYNGMIAAFDEIVAPLDSIDIAADGTADDADEAGLQALKEAERRLYAACDDLFGGNMSEAFFGKMNPFSPVGGKFYCEIALDAVGKYIAARFEKEVKQISSRVDKYTHGYRTGKHKDGKK